MKSNAEELPEIFKICSQYGIYRVKVDYLNVTNDLDVQESLFFHPELAARVFTESRHRAKEWGIQVELNPMSSPDWNTYRHLSTQGPKRTSVHLPTLIKLPSPPLFPALMSE